MHILIEANIQQKQHPNPSICWYALDDYYVLHIGRPRMHVTWYHLTSKRVATEHIYKTKNEDTTPQTKRRLLL